MPPAPCPYPRSLSLGLFISCEPFIPDTSAISCFTLFLSPHPARWLQHRRTVPRHGHSATRDPRQGKALATRFHLWFQLTEGAGQSLRERRLCHCHGGTQQQQQQQHQLQSNWHRVLGRRGTDWRKFLGELHVAQCATGKSKAETQKLFPFAAKTSSKRNLDRSLKTPQNPQRNFTFSFW